MSALGFFNAAISAKKLLLDISPFASATSTGSRAPSPSPYTESPPSRTSLVNQLASWTGIDAMPEATEDPKSPKTPRRATVTDEPKQVRFQANGDKVKPPLTPAQATAGISASSKATQDNQKQQQEPINTQPTSFPQLGAAPNSAFGAGQWYTTADPSQSLNQLPPSGQLYNTSWPGAVPAGGCFANAHPGAHFFSPPPHLVNHTVFPAFTSVPFPFACVGLPPPLLHCLCCHHHYSFLHHSCPPYSQLAANDALPTARGFNTMADYHNTVPPPCGVNFQPPVPDTTFGPMPHVYVPRFDGGCASGVQVGHPHVQFVPAAPTCTTVFVPKTFYVNSYTYYAS